MAAVGVDVTQRSWSASVVEQVHEGVDTFGVAEVEAVGSITLDGRFLFHLRRILCCWFDLKSLLTPRTKRDIHVSISSLASKKQSR